MSFIRNATREIISLTGASSNFVLVITGSGSPESVEIAPVGSIFLRIDGAVGSTLYVKQTGNGSTGWTATAGAALVSSVFGRSGAVSAQSADYNFSQIGGTAARSQIAPVVWSVKSGNFTAVVGEGYITTATLTATLPSGAAGDTVRFVHDGSAHTNMVTAPAGRTVEFGQTNLPVTGLGATHEFTLVGTDWVITNSNIG